MDCSEVGELLDAYALGATDSDEAASLEEHVADCVRCWSSLNEAQRVAAAIALSTAIQRAPESLRERILKETEQAEQPLAPRLPGFLRKLLPAGVGMLAAGAAASLVFAFVLQSQVNDLRNDNDQLHAVVEDTGQQLTDQRQLMAVLAAPDVEHVTLAATDPASPASAVYHWSGSTGAGALLCNNLPPLQEGQVYKFWFITEGDSYPAGSFETWDGIGQLTLDLLRIPERPVAIGVSTQDAADSDEPGEMLLYGELNR